jgi:catechol 2,3-dioxygenase
MMKTTDGVDRVGRDGQVQIPGTIGRTPGLNHIAWEVPSEAALLDAYRNLQRTGVPLDTAMDHQIAHSLYLFDPDGNYNEMYCDTVQDWRGVLAGEMDLITSRWDPEQAEGSAEPRHPVGTEPRTNPEAPLQPRRITHLVLETPQIEAMTRFYCDIVGLQIVSRHAGSVFLDRSPSIGGAGPRPQ